MPIHRRIHLCLVSWGFQSVYSGAKLTTFFALEALGEGDCSILFIFMIDVEEETFPHFRPPWTGGVQLYEDMFIVRSS